MANMGRGEDDHYELDASDEFHTYDATDGPGGGRTVFVIFALLLALFVFGGVLYLAYQQGIKEGIRNAPPVIEADDTPAKVVPDDPGGMDIPNTDKLIYDRMNGKDPAEPGVEHLLPRAEEPIEIEEVPIVPPSEADRPRDKVEVLPPPLDLVPETDADDRVSEPASPTVPVPAAPGNRTRPAPAVIPAEPAGKFVVQIAAFRDVPRAEAEFAKLQEAHPDLLSALRSDIERADLGDRGIYYRLRVGPFATKDAASSLCTRLKGRGQDCLVRER